MDGIDFALKLARAPRGIIDALVRKTVADVELEPHVDRNRRSCQPTAFGVNGVVLLLGHVRKWKTDNDAHDVLPTVWQIDHTATAGVSSPPCPFEHHFAGAGAGRRTGSRLYGSDQPIAHLTGPEPPQVVHLAMDSAGRIAESVFQPEPSNRPATLGALTRRVDKNKPLRSGRRRLGWGTDAPIPHAIDGLSPVTREEPAGSL